MAKYKRKANAIHVTRKKALYGMLNVALLFRRLLSDRLIEWRLVLNPYNQCLANKVINGEQFMTHR